MKQIYLIVCLSAFVFSQATAHSTPKEQMAGLDKQIQLLLDGDIEGFKQLSNHRIEQLRLQDSHHADSERHFNIALINAVQSGDNESTLRSLNERFRKLMADDDENAEVAEENLEEGNESKTLPNEEPEGDEEEVGVPMSSEEQADILIKEYREAPDLVEEGIEYEIRTEKKDYASDSKKSEFVGQSEMFYKKLLEALQADDKDRVRKLLDNPMLETETKICTEQEKAFFVLYVLGSLCLITVCFGATTFWVKMIMKSRRQNDDAPADVQETEMEQQKGQFQEVPDTQRTEQSEKDDEK